MRVSFLDFPIYLFYYERKLHVQALSWTDMSTNPYRLKREYGTHQCYISSSSSFMTDLWSEESPIIVSLMGESEYSWYGYHSDCRSTNNGKVTQAVGSPMDKLMKEQSIGFVDLIIDGEPVTRLYGGTKICLDAFHF